MKLLFSLLSLFLIVLIESCNHYENDGSTVYYKSWNEGTGSSKKELTGVDAEKFHVLTYDRYAKDDHIVFFDGNLIKGADAKTFEAIGEIYGRDKYRGYYAGDSIRSSNGPTFKIIDSYYSTDSKDIFYRTNPLKVVSVKKFKFVFDSDKSDYQRWATDGQFYYFMDCKIPSDDYNHVILYKNSGGIAKDRKWAYYLDRKLNYNDSGKRMIDTIDITTFKVTGYLDCRDKYGCINIYHGRENCEPGN